MTHQLYLYNQSQQIATGSRGVCCAVQTDVKTSLTRWLRIFVYTSDECPRFPVRVVVAEGAKVLDVIGLTCFLYTRDNCTPPLE